MERANPRHEPVILALSGNAARPLGDALQRRFSTLARDNRWMNERLYRACAAMPDAAGLALDTQNPVFEAPAFPAPTS